MKLTGKAKPLRSIILRTVIVYPAEAGYFLALQTTCRFNHKTRVGLFRRHAMNESIECDIPAGAREELEKQ